MSKTLYCNGEIYSPLLSGDVLTAKAMLVENGRITRIGSDFGSEDYPDAECVDLDGASVLPGMCDSHLHAVWTTETIYAGSLDNMYDQGNDTRESLLKKYTDSVAAFAAG